jgi:transposase
LGVAAGGVVFSLLGLLSITPAASQTRVLLGTGITYLGEKQVAVLIGLAPMNNDSGKYIGKRCIKGGRTWLRHLLYQAALVAPNHNPALKSFAQRLKERGKPHKLVLIAVA